jgi:hypothetical protein
MERDRERMREREGGRERDNSLISERNSDFMFEDKNESAKH